MADAAWKKLKDKVTAKRGKKRDAGDTTHKLLQGKELTVQRLSSEVSGKAQKYARIGPREFVPFTEDELTIENIKRCCERHFATQVGTSLVCDILAGEQGPSCKTLEQIPDMKVIYVRFVTGNNIQDCAPEWGISKSDLEMVRTHSHTLTRSEGPTHPPKVAKGSGASSSPSKFAPLSLSVADMIKLGKIGTTQGPTTVVHLHTFDMDLLSWSKLPLTVEFNEEKEPFAHGGFRNAYKATTKHPQFKGTTWVIKRYLPDALKGINDIGQTVQQHTQKVVQMHLLARNFACQLEQKIVEKHAIDAFGKVPRYRKIYYGEDDKGECVTVEEFIDGKFTKYLNNTGDCCVDETDVMGQKAQCLSHFSYEKSDKKLMLLDIQGSGYELFDPEIASHELFDGSAEVLYCAGNLSQMAIDKFVSGHKCNIFCDIIGLKSLNTD